MIMDAFRNFHRTKTSIMQREKNTIYFAD